MNAISRVWCMATALGALIAAGSSAHAQEICIPTGTLGVPGTPGIPNWWSSTATFDDARWLGAYGYSQNTAKMSAFVEVMGSDKALILKWHVKGDAGAAVAGDQVYVGFYNPTTTVGTILLLTRDASASTAGGSQGADVMTVTALTRTGSTGFFTDATVPATVLSDARIDTLCDDTVTPSTCDEWAIRLRVPTSVANGGIDLGDTFRMWSQVDVEHEGVAPTRTIDHARFPNATLLPNGTPTAFPEPLGSASPVSPAWNLVRIAGSGTCVTGVDMISHSDVVVTNPSGTGTEIHMTAANAFHVRPHNNTTTVYNGDSIKARVRIADWGSAVGDSPSWLTLPGTGCDAATGDGSTTVSGGAQFDLSCNWTLTAEQRCAYRPDLYSSCSPMPTPRYRHQCITAELSANSSTPVSFARDSYWNNFNFGPASTLERLARIDIGTLSPRDVYLYVDTKNMPAIVAAPTGGGEGGTGGEGQGGQGEGNEAGGQRLARAQRVSPALLKELRGKLEPGRVTHEQAQVVQRLLASGAITYEDVEAVMPTYTVYAWHDTGVVEQTKRGPAKVVEAQPSFTLFVSHDGALHGWKHSLEGVGGVTVEPIGNNFYRVAVGASGNVEVKTIVKAIEDQCEADPSKCDKCVVNPDAPGCKPSPCVTDPNGAACKQLCEQNPSDASCPKCKYPLCLELWQWLLILLVVAILLAFLLRKRN